MLCVLAAGCAAEAPAAPATPPPTPEPIVADSTPPRDVLEVFLKTLLIGDCLAARQLSTEAGFAQVGGFCQRIHISNFAVVGNGTSVGNDAITFATTLTIDGGGGVLMDGDHTIFFSLGRQASGAWRVTGGGSGP